MDKIEDYELRLANGTVVTWRGTSGENAAQRYADAHQGAVVIGYRYANRHGFFPYVKPILEPGEWK